VCNPTASCNKALKRSYSARNAQLPASSKRMKPLSHGPALKFLGPALHPLPMEPAHAAI
jgi:hypothetical protein